MALKQQLDQDIKTALLSGDKSKAEVLKSLKSAVLYEEVAQKLRDTGLTDDQMLVVFAREAKKRGESAELYKKAGESDRAAAELSEKEIIDSYLPKQLSNEDLEAIVDEVVSQNPGANMGQLMGLVRAKVGQRAEGGRIAQVVKAKIGG